MVGVELTGEPGTGIDRGCDLGTLLDARRGERNELDAPVCARGSGCETSLFKLIRKRGHIRRIAGELLRDLAHPQRLFEGEDRARQVYGQTNMRGRLREFPASSLRDGDESAREFTRLGQRGILLLLSHIPIIADLPMV